MKIIKNNKLIKVLNFEEAIRTLKTEQKDQESKYNDQIQDLERQLENAKTSIASLEMSELEIKVKLEEQIQQKEDGDLAFEKKEKDLENEINRLGQLLHDSEEKIKQFANVPAQLQILQENVNLKKKKLFIFC